MVEHQFVSLRNWSWTLVSSSKHVVSIFEVHMSASECGHCLAFIRGLGAFMEGQMLMRVHTLSSLDLGELFGLGVTHIAYIGANEYTY